MEEKDMEFCMSVTSTAVGLDKLNDVVKSQFRKSYVKKDGDAFCVVIGDPRDLDMDEVQCIISKQVKLKYRCECRFW
jgi:hypothetical protein